jgi:hypothetical protein
MVLFKRKPEVKKNDQRYLNAVQLLMQLSDSIPNIIEMRAGENFSERPIAHDFGLMVVLPNEKALQAYSEHPFHKSVVQAWKLIADWTIADFWATVRKVEE